MKRSQINAALKELEAMCSKYSRRCPFLPFHPGAMAAFGSRV